MASIFQLHSGSSHHVLGLLDKGIGGGGSGIEPSIVWMSFFLGGGGGGFLSELVEEPAVTVLVFPAFTGCPRTADTLVLSMIE